jgi:hypothetical protein
MLIAQGSEFLLDIGVLLPAFSFFTLSRASSRAVLASLIFPWAIASKSGVLRKPQSISMKNRNATTPAMAKDVGSHFAGMTFATMSSTFPSNSLSLLGGLDSCCFGDMATSLTRSFPPTLPILHWRDLYHAVWPVSRLVVVRNTGPLGFWTRRQLRGCGTPGGEPADEIQPFPPTFGTSSSIDPACRGGI